ncbi:MAG: cyclic nucleotide-binding domain-containing protein [Rhizobiaceae bacterium]
MKSLLQYCSGLPKISLDPNQEIISEQSVTNRLYVLEEGVLEVHRDEEPISMVNEPGAVFGEMSVLLSIPHTANVRAVTASSVYVVDDASTYLEKHPEFLMPIAQILASRLRNSTTYLVDLKKQFKDHSDHFAMVDEVLESMAHEQVESFTPDEDLPIDP